MIRQTLIAGGLWLCLAVFLVEGFNVKREPCEPYACAVVLCLRPDCESPYTLVSGGGYCGCCPICAMEVDVGGSCDQDILIQSRICKEGLICDPDTSTCIQI